MFGIQSYDRPDDNVSDIDETENNSSIFLKAHMGTKENDPLFKKVKGFCPPSGRRFDEVIQESKTSSENLSVEVNEYEASSVAYPDVYTGTLENDPLSHKYRGFYPPTGRPFAAVLEEFRCTMGSPNQQQNEAKKKITKEAEAEMREGNKANALQTMSIKIADALSLKVVNGDILKFDGVVWKSLTDDELILEVNRYYDRRGTTTPPGLITNQNKFIRFIKGNPKIQMDPYQFDSYRNYINLLDCVYDCEGDCFKPAEPGFFFTTSINISKCDIMSRNNTGAFDQICDNSFNGDPQLRKLLLQIIGAIVCNDDLKKFFVLWGESNTGKSVVLDFIRDIVGEDRCLALTEGLSALSNRFGLSDIKGKKLIFTSDASNVRFNNATIGIIKTLSGGCDSNLISAERKYQNRIAFKNTAKILMSTNHPLKMSSKDPDIAFQNRLLVVPFANEVPPEKQDDTLLERLKKEKGRIFMDALHEYAEVKKNRYQFVEAISAEEFLNPKQYVKSADYHVEQFINECCIVDGYSKTETSCLYNAYVKYCKDNQLHFTENPSTFTQHARKISGTGLCRINGGKNRAIEGISLSGPFAPKTNHM